MAMIGEEALEVDLVGAALGLREADRFDKSLGLLVLDLSEVICVMNAAEVNEIESSSSEHEERFKVKCVGHGGDVIDHTALIGELKLRYSAKLVVDRSRIREQVGIVFYAAAQAIFLLRNFRLNGKYLKHFFFPFDSLAFLEISDLLGSEVSPFSDLERAEADISYSNAAKARYFQLLLLTHLAYLAVSALVKSHFKRA